jgi:hypothetical protein
MKTHEQTREEIEKRMDEITRNYVESHDHEIIEELYKLSLKLREMEEAEKKD